MAYQGGNDGWFSYVPRPDGRSTSGSYDSNPGTLTLGGTTAPGVYLASQNWFVTNALFVQPAVEIYGRDWNWATVREAGPSVLVSPRTRVCGRWACIAPC